MTFEIREAKFERQELKSKSPDSFFLRLRLVQLSRRNISQSLQVYAFLNHPPQLHR